MLAAVLARRGIERVVATDLDPRAVACAREASPVPDDLRSAYEASLMHAEEMTLACFVPGIDDTTGLELLIALAGTGLLTTVGVIVAMDTFGPVSDNAQGIAEMSGDVHGEGAQILTDLDAVGNTTNAITKGIAIATAVLAAMAAMEKQSGGAATPPPQ